jgi:hypothetical protein
MNCINGLSQNHTISISGGNEKNDYLFSFGYLDQQGTLLNTYLKRFTTRINSDFTILDIVKIGENLQLSYTDNPKPNEFVPHISSPDDENAAINGDPSSQCMTSGEHGTAVLTFPTRS